jgi:hypothetical protein
MSLLERKLGIHGNFDKAHTYPVPVALQGLTKPANPVSGILQSVHNSKLRWLINQIEPSPKFEGTKSERIEKEAKAIIQGKHAQAPNKLDSLPQPLFTNDLTLIKSLLAKDSQGQACPDVTKVLNFCKMVIDQSGVAPSTKIIPSSTPYNEDPKVQQTKELLGIIMYFLDQDHTKLLSLLDTAQYDASVKSLRDLFVKDMQERKKVLDFSVAIETEEGTQLFDYELVKGFHLPIELANVMVLSNGELNLGLSGLMKKCFFDPSIDFSYQEVISRALDVLKMQPTLVQTFEGVVKPQNPNFKSNTLIRSMLNLDPTTEITNRHAKILAFATFLSKLRQGPIGSCFATSVGINLQILRPDKFMQDIVSILQSDKLVRKVDSESHNIQYVLDATNDALTTELSLFKDGILSNGTNLLDSWALKAACKQMGIPESNTKKAISDAILALTGGKSAKITPFQIIEKIAAMNFNENAQDRADIGKVGFCAIDNNMLLRAWEELIAAMAEVRPHGLVRGSLLNSISAALSDQFKPRTLSDKKVMQVFNKTLLDTVNTQLDLRYDPSTTLDDDSNANTVSSDGKSNFDAAFVMYDTKGNEVQTPSEFEETIRSYVDMTAQICAKQFTSNQEAQSLQDTAKKIMAFVGSKTFLRLAIINFDEENKKVNHPEDNWETLDGLPWRARYGNDPGEVLDVYFERTKDLVPYTFTPQNAQDLMVTLLDVAKQHQSETHYLDDDNPNETLELTSPQHAFEFMIKSDSMKVAVKDSRNARDWVQDYVSKHGKIFAETKLTPEIKSKILQKTEHMLDNPNHKAEFKAKISKMTTQHVTVDDLRKELLTITQYVTKEDVKDKKDIKNIVNMACDQHILSMQKGVLDSLKPFIIHFADTNWNDGDHSIHFCFVPYGNTVLLGTVFDDGTNLQVVDQDEWVNRQEWQVYKTSLTALA